MLSISRCANSFCMRILFFASKSFSSSLFWISTRWCDSTNDSHWLFSEGSSRADEELSSASGIELFAMGIELFAMGIELSSVPSTALISAPSTALLSAPSTALSPDGTTPEESTNSPTASVTGLSALWEPEVDAD